jgi:predicted ferric reductase
VAPDVTPRRRRALHHAQLVGLAVGLGALVTAGMWLRHGQLDAAHGPGGAATAVGQLSALLGTYAVLVEVLLMSRIAWLERAIGLDRLSVWHRWTGFAVVWLLSAHVLFSTLGWARGSIPPTGVVHETFWMIAHEPDILMAWAGYGLLLAVAFTSMRAARRRLQRETWFSVHLYVYLAVALAFAHQLAVGSDFDGDRAARIWWIGLYVLVFGAIVWWRVVEPLRFNARHELRVHQVVAESPNVWSVVMRGKNLDRAGMLPGQFFLWRFLTPDRWWQAHPYSLSAAPTHHHLRITVKSLGDGSARVRELRPGTRVFAEGPYGTFTADRRTTHKVLLIGGGIGITPLRALLDTMGRNDDVVVLYRVAGPEDTVFGDELRRMTHERNVVLYILPGDEIGDDQTDLLSVPALQRGVPDIRSRDCYVCGPGPMMDAVLRRLRLLGVPQTQIHYERFEL